MVIHNCNFCNGQLKETFENDQIKVGTCTICGMQQLYYFDHIDSKLYTTNENLPSNFREERIRQQPWNFARVNLLQNCLYKLNDKSVIDYGCGTGAFLEYSKNKFKSIIGFDVSQEACDINNNDKLYCVSDINLINQNKYDILTMFHVLEHIKNPVEFLKQVMEIDAEYFAVEVPHTNEALVSLYNNKKYMNNHYCLDHLWYYTEETLKMVLNKAGLEVIESNQIQRYPLSNHLKWLSNKDEEIFSIFDQVSDQYVESLIENKIADSLFMICKRA